MPIEEDETLRVVLTPGLIRYTDRSGTRQTLHFQFNPENLSRARTVNVVETKTNTKAERNSSLKRGTSGRKFTLDPQRWQISDLKIRIDASKPHWTDAGKLGDPDKFDIAAVQTAIRHLERLVEPLGAPTENDSPYGFEAVEDPPPVEFAWGKRAWPCFVTNVTINETQFTNDLVPMRVEATLGLTIIPTIPHEKQGKTGGTK